MKDLLLEDARDFLQSKEWYSERGIPFRRGYLLVSHRAAGASLPEADTRRSTAHQDQARRQ